MRQEAREERGLLHEIRPESGYRATLSRARGARQVPDGPFVVGQVATAAIHAKIETVDTAQRGMHLARERLEATALAPKPGARHRNPHGIPRQGHRLRPTHIRKSVRRSFQRSQASRW